MPTPMSHWTFTEGSGTTATSLVGGYTLTDVSGWAGGGGITSSTRGIIGAGSPTSWTVAFDMILTWVVDGSFQQFIIHPVNGSGYWLQVQNGWPQIWRGDALNANPTTLHSAVPCQLVFTVTPTHQVIYIDGALIVQRDTTSIAYDTSATTGVWGWGGTTPSGTLKKLRFYDTALTATEVANIDAPPGTPVSVSFTGSGTLSGTGFPKGSAAAALSGAGTLSATVTAVPVLTAAPAFTGAGALSATVTAVESHAVAAAFTAAGALHASAHPPSVLNVYPDAVLAVKPENITMAVKPEKQTVTV